jgi:hypothetical protein
MKRSVVPVIISIAAVVGLALLGFLFGGHVERGPAVLDGGIARTLMQVVVTGGLLIASLLVILSSRYSESDKKWAYGTVGTLVGFWLKG